MRPADMGAHNRDQILQALALFGPMRSKNLVDRLGLSPRTTRVHLKALREAGKVERVGHDYRLAEGKGAR